MLDSSKFTKLFMTMGNNWLIHALLLTYESTNTFMLRSIFIENFSSIDLLTVLLIPLKIDLFAKNILTASYFSSNSSFSLYTLARACILHLKFQSMLVSFLSQSLLFNTTCITVYPMPALQVHQCFLD